MTQKLLFLLDTDPVPSVFDTVVGYDGGADHVIGYGGVTTDNVGALVDGAIYTRGPKEKQFTALFVGGGSMVKGEALFKTVKKRFFSNFRVSTMLDSNGSNTTAAAGVALLAKAKPLAGMKAVVLAGTGPVGMRAAAMLHIEGAEVALTSRQLARAKASSEAIKERFGFAPTPIEAADNAARATAVKGAQVVFAAGAIGVSLLDEKDWQNDPDDRASRRLQRAAAAGTGRRRGDGQGEGASRQDRHRRAGARRLEAEAASRMRGQDVRGRRQGVRRREHLRAGQRTRLKQKGTSP